MRSGGTSVKTVTDGWKVTYRKQNSAFASWSGTKGDQIVYERAIPACNGAAAYFRLEYHADAKEAFDPVILRLVQSLQSDRCINAYQPNPDFPTSLYGVWEPQPGYCKASEDSRIEGQRLEIIPGKARGSAALVSHLDHENSDGSGFCEIQSVEAEGVEILAPSLCGSYHHSGRWQATLHFAVSPSGQVMSVRWSVQGEESKELYYRCR